MENCKRCVGCGRRKNWGSVGVYRLKEIGAARKFSKVLTLPPQENKLLFSIALYGDGAILQTSNQVSRKDKTICCSLLI